MSNAEWTEAVADDARSYAGWKWRPDWDAGRHDSGAVIARRVGGWEWTCRCGREGGAEPSRAAAMDAAESPCGSLAGAASKGAHP